MAFSLTVASAPQRVTEVAVAHLVDRLALADASLVLVFHSARHDATLVSGLLAQAAPGARVVGCTSSGEVGPGGVTAGGMVAMALSGCRVAVRLVPDVDRWSFAQGARLVSDLAGELEYLPSELDPERHLFVLLSDGLSGGGERLGASISDVLPRIPLVGGGAGDDFQMKETWVSLDGLAAAAAGVVLLLEPGVPFRHFALNHFDPSAHRMIVTAASPGARLVHELNGWSATEEYARVVGVDVDELRGGRLDPASIPVQFALMVGGEPYVRGVMAIQGDSLVMASPVEVGTVFRVAYAGDLVKRTRDGLARVLVDVPGGVCGLLIFDCYGRQSLAQREGLTQTLDESVQVAPLVGFHTYGEQFGPLGLNFTLTGVAFGGNGGGDGST